MEVYGDTVDFFVPIFLFFLKECAKVHPKMCFKRTTAVFLWHIFLFFRILSCTVCKRQSLRNVIDPLAPFPIIKQ